jgi:hypothetical protein
MLLLLVSDGAEEVVVRVRSAENADAEEEVGVLDRRKEKNPPDVAIRATSRERGHGYSSFCVRPGGRDLVVQITVVPPSTTSSMPLT